MIVGVGVMVKLSSSGIPHWFVLFSGHHFLLHVVHGMQELQQGWCSSAVLYLDASLQPPVIETADFRCNHHRVYEVAISAGGCFSGLTTAIIALLCCRSHCATCARARSMIIFLEPVFSCRSAGMRCRAKLSSHNQSTHFQPFVFVWPAAVCVHFVYQES